jgi:hypothetical protein
MQRRRNNLVLVVLVALAAPLLLAGCGESLSEKITEKAIEKAGGEDVDIDVDGEEVKIKTKDGDASFSSTTELPKDWPDDIELPKGAKIAAASRIKADGGVLLTVAGIVKDGDVVDVVDHFADQFDGWKEVGSTDIGSDGDEIRNLVYSKGDSTATVTVSLTDGESDVNFAVALQLK